MKLPNWQHCGLDRNTPRTFVADLAINPQTGHAQVINHRPILAQETDNSQVRENMKQLLDIILGFFEDEMKKVEAGTLKEEDMLMSPYVQKNDTNTQHNPRPIPENFKRRRA